MYPKGFKVLYNLYFRNQQTNAHIIAFVQIIDLTLYLDICSCIRLFIIVSFVIIVFKKSLPFCGRLLLYNFDLKFKQ